MSRWLTTRGWNLAANWPLPIRAAIYTTAFRTRPSQLIPSRFYSSVKNPRVSWVEWLKLHPTSVEQLQTVYHVCEQSRVFAPAVRRPVVSDGERPPYVLKHVRHGDASRLAFTFRKTPGLQPEDWEARGIEFSHATVIALQLQLSHIFSENRDFDSLVKSWPEFIEKVEADNGLAKMGKTIAEQRKTLLTGKTAKTTAAANEVLEERKEVDMAFQARQALRMRKKAELDSDAAEGIKSKRRPLRLAATSKGVPLAFETMKTLRRVERGGRDIIVDKEVKKRTREADAERKLVQRNKYEPARRHGNYKEPVRGNEPGTPKEKRGDRGLEKIKLLAKKSAEVLTAIIEAKTNKLEEAGLESNKRKSADRQLRRAKQALSWKSWEEGGPNERPSEPDTTSR